MTLASPALARAVVGELLAAGIRDVVAAPGSRNAGLLLVAAACAAAGDIRLHMRIDERDAAFSALGIALATDRPVAVCTTSGTAVGNLLPAVMEAHHSYVPLVVISADRPTSVLDSGANQTTRQRGILAGFVRADAHLEAGVASEANVRHQVTRLLAMARGDRTLNPGPAHLNVAFAPPLIAPGITRHVEVPTPPTVTRSRLGPPTELDPGRRTVVLAGHARPATGRAARQLAAGARIPLFAEPSSNARFGDAIATYRLHLHSELGRRIERVIVFGNPTLSRPVAALLARPEVEVVVVADHAEWTDSSQRATRITHGVSLLPGARDWLAAWQCADAECLAEFDPEDLCGRSISTAVVASLQPGHSLVYGASQLIRDADLATVPSAEFATWANRGLSGIDGTTATAMGVAAARGKTVALLGDVTAVHDVGGLGLPSTEHRPDLRVVIGNDDGGAIFSYLEQGAPPYADHFERVFATPHGIDFAALAAAYGWDYRRPTTIADLRAELAHDWTGLQLIEVPLPR